VNTMQQVGGAVGPGLLNTHAATPATPLAPPPQTNPAVGDLGAVHSYVVAFWWSAGIFVVGAAIVAALLRPGVPDFNANAGNVVVL
jgi:hypothetical protein